jgi:hypothetical protein
MLTGQPITPLMVYVKTTAQQQDQMSAEGSQGRIRFGTFQLDGRDYQASRKLLGESEFLSVRCC